MRIPALAALMFCLASGVAAQTYYGTTDVNAFRHGRDGDFRNRSESPLKEEDLTSFKGLNYYAVDPAFRVPAAFERTLDEKYFEMATSAGKTKSYVKYGILKFQLDGKPHRLSVYQADRATLNKFPEYAGLLFIPFRDGTNRSETYGGGRYIDIKMPEKGTITLDFNLAYNPSCAYGSGRYNCPIPPSENTIAVEIRAGEKRFPYSENKTTTEK